MKYLISETRVKMGLLHSRMLSLKTFYSVVWQGTFKESVIKKFICIVGNTINTGFLIGVFKGGDGEGGNIFVFRYKRHGYMMSQL